MLQEQLFLGGDLVAGKLLESLCRGRKLGLRACFHRISLVFIGFRANSEDV